MIKTSLERKREGADLHFIPPSVTIFTVFVFIPLIIAFIFSFLKFDMIFQNFQFQKLGNYAKLAGDKKLWDALFNTVYYIAFTVPVQIGPALVTAVVVKRKGWLNGFFKFAYLIPAICSMTIVPILWSFLVSPDTGMFCYWAKLLGFNSINALSSSTWAMPTVILVSVWKNFGFNVIILLVGLNGTGEPYYEAANINGATGLQKFRGITIPMLMPTLSFTAVNCTIGSFQVFDQVYIMMKGGPLFKTQILVQLIYSMVLDSSSIGYASIIAVTLSIIAFIILVFTFKHTIKGEEDLG